MDLEFYKNITYCSVRLKKKQFQSMSYWAPKNILSPIFFCIESDKKP